MEDKFSHEFFMEAALREAQRAFEEDEVPIGAVVASGNEIIARGYNQTIRLNDNTAHAEMIAITAAFDRMNSRILEECRIYVTIEPCVMCAGAVFWARPAMLVYGADEPKHGFSRLGSILHNSTEVVKGVMAADAAALMKEFFRRKRL